MKYLSIRGWILSQDNLYYDFVEDTIGSAEALEAYEKLDNVLDKFFIYRSELYDEKYNSLLEDDAKETCEQFLKNAKRYQTKDPDRYSPLLRKIYIHLWGYVFLSNYCNCSDTMTSAQVLVNKCIECIEKEEKKGENIELNRIYREKKNIKGSINSSIALAACNECTNLYKSLNNTIPELERFLALYHTIGNYSPIPEGFNVPRSSAGKKDFWDLTLAYIRKYYLQSNEEEKRRIIYEGLLNSHKNSNPEKVIVWLKFYGDGDNGWKRFVEFNFYQDFVYDDYKVVPFWNNHDEYNLHIPTEKEDLKKALTTICNLIEKRGNRIVNSIKMTDFLTFYHC